MEDEGTPPAVQDGFLSGEVSPSYNSSRMPSRQWQGGPNGPHKSNFKRGMKHKVPEAAGRVSAVDLIMLLEENWFWRSSTASPSMTQDGPADVVDYARTPSHQSQSRGYWTSENSLPDNQEACLGEALSSDTSSEIDANVMLSDNWDRGNDGKCEDREALDSRGPSLLSRKSQSADLDAVAAAASHQARLPQSCNTHVPQHRLDRAPARKKEGEVDLDAMDTIGTWGHRVLRFQPAKKRSSPTHIPGTPDEPEEQPRSARNRQRTAHPGSPEPRRTPNDDEVAAVNAAWRWRFNRRWRTEQAKQLDPEFGLDGEGDDGWDDALGYLEACGPGVQHQIARTTSLEHGLASASLASNGSEASQFLVDNSQKEKGDLRKQAEMDATKRVRAVAKKAQDLYRQQQKIERDVKARWGSSQFRMSWAGQHMKAVQIDTQGSFRFILARVNDRTSAHRLLVRGKSGTSIDDLLREVTAEANTTSKEHQMPQLSVVLIGTGVVSWGLGQDRKVNFSSGHAEKIKDPSVQTGADVCRVAGALTRTSMPGPTLVTVNGKRLS